MKIYKVGVVGCGNIASNYDKYAKEFALTHLGGYKKHPQTEVTAICDINKTALISCAKCWKVNNYYTTIKDLLENHELDIISVATPYETHYKIVRQIIEIKKPKAIFCEKPITNNLIDARNLIRLCEENNIILVINHQRRYDRIHELIKERLFYLIGDIQKLTFWYSGGIINSGSHLFDILRFHFGDIAWIQADFSNYDSELDLDILIKFKSGLKGSILSCASNNFSIFEMDLLGAKARFDLIDKHMNEYDYRYFLKEEHELGPLLINKSEIPLSEKLPRDHFVRAISDIIQCIETNKKPISAGEDAYKALEAITASIVSAQNKGKRIYIPLKQEYLREDIKLPKIIGEFKKWEKKN